MSTEKLNLKKMEKQEINKISAETPTHAYVLWETGEKIGYNMKEVCEKLGIGKTRFKTNVRNRYICRVKI